MWSKNVNSRKCRMCKRRGVGGEKKPKHSQRSLWTTPKAKLNNFFALSTYRFNALYAKITVLPPHKFKNYQRVSMKQYRGKEVSKLDFTSFLIKNNWSESLSLWCHLLFKLGVLTGKSFSEALILASTNPQYDKRLFIELRVQYMKIVSSEHVENMLCTQIGFCFDIQNNLCTQHVLRAFWAYNFHVLNL